MKQTDEVCLRKWIRRFLPHALLGGLLLACACAPARESAPVTLTGQGRLIVEMVGFRNSRGVARVWLFASAKGFPDEEKGALVSAQGEIREGRCELTFPHLPFGAYAVSVLHDEDGDNRMAVNLFGMPREGLGLSNGLGSRRFGPPTFAEARFLFLMDGLRVPVKVEYLDRRRDERRQRRQSP